MSTITLPNIRVGSDLQIRVRLKDGGVAIDWSTLSNIKACIYSDAQRALAGRCAFSIDEEDNTLLVCTYAANKPQYLGVNRIVISAKYMGETKTYDKPAFTFVRWTADQEGEEITIDDPDVDVEIEVEDVSSSLLDQAIAAALAAAAAAEHAAHLIPNQVLLDAEAATVAANAAADAANAAGITSAQVSIADDEPGTPSAEVSLANKVLSIIFHHLKGNTGDAAGFGTITATVDDVVGDPSVTVTVSGPDTAKNFTFAFHGLRGIQGVPGVANAKYKSVDTLPTASAATMDFIYLTPSGTTGVYNMSYTEQDGSTYSWQDLGTTAIQLSDYATKAEVSQLEAKVDGFVTPVNIENGGVSTDYYIQPGTSKIAYLANSGYSLVKFPIKKDFVYHLTVPSMSNKNIGVYAFLDGAVQTSKIIVLPNPVEKGPVTNAEYEFTAPNHDFLIVTIDTNSAIPTLIEDTPVPGLVEKVQDLEQDVQDLEQDVQDLEQKDTSLEMRVRPLYYLPTAVHNYEEYVQEVLVVSLPSGNCILKYYDGSVYLFTASTSIFARESLENVKNGEVVAVKVYASNDHQNYPIGKIVGYVVLRDVEGFKADSTSSETAEIDRDVAENISFAPIIFSYLNGGDIQEQVEEEIENNIATRPGIGGIDICVPDTIYAVVGDTLQLYYRSIFRCVDFSQYSVHIVCNIGNAYPRYYELTPTAGNIGTHQLTIAIKDNNNKTFNTKDVNLVVVSAGVSPANELNVLCLGASATQGGQWASEFKRRLVASGGTPSGSNLSNIVFVGRKDVTFDGKQVNLEATGGYSFTSYTNPGTARYRFNFDTDNEPTINVGDVYSNNGNNYTVKEKNMTAGYFSCEGTGSPLSSGTLTKVSGTGSDTVSYLSTSFSGNPFAYGGVIDVQRYADEFCNPQNAEHGRIDVVYTELFGNGSHAYTDDISPRLEQMQALITQIRTTFPNCKFCIGLQWNPDIRGGMGRDYGANGDWSDAYAMKYTFMNICNAVQQYITENNLSGYVYIVNWLNEFDEENDMQQMPKTVNVRSSVTEVFGRNGIHPSMVGYNQMADSAWRVFIAKFCQS